MAPESRSEVVSEMSHIVVSNSFVLFLLALSPNAINKGIFSTIYLYIAHILDEIKQNLRTSPDHRATVPFLTQIIKGNTDDFSLLMFFCF